MPQRNMPGTKKQRSVSRPAQGEGKKLNELFLLTAAGGTPGSKGRPHMPLADNGRTVPKKTYN